MPKKQDDEEEKAGKELASFFFRTLEVRWAVTDLLLRSLIRHAAISSGDRRRFVASVFDDASALVDLTMDNPNSNREIGNEIHALIDSLAARVADDLGAFPHGSRARKPRGNGPKSER